MKKASSYADIKCIATMYVMAEYKISKKCSLNAPLMPIPFVLLSLGREDATGKNAIEYMQSYKKTLTNATKTPKDKSCKLKLTPN